MATHKLVPGGLWSDPLSYILPHSDAEYQEALAERSKDPESYSSLNGLFTAFGCALIAWLRSPGLHGRAASAGNVANRWSGVEVGWNSMG